MDDPLASYYAERAWEYEEVYQKPERQDDLNTIKSLLPLIFKNKRVLEIACGTGYWTEVVATSAQSIVATDINEEVVNLARKKHYGTCDVRFQQLDAFGLNTLTDPFDAILCAFWWSHLHKKDIHRFLDGLKPFLKPKTLVLFLDNRYIEGSCTPISHVDEDGNTYQMRTLKDGKQYRILKNFPTAEELHASLEPYVGQIDWTEFHYYWMIQCIVKS